MFGSTEKAEVGEFFSCFQGPCTNYRRLTIETIPIFQCFLTIKSYLSHDSEVWMGKGSRHRGTLLQSWPRTHTFSTMGWPLPWEPAPSSWLVGDEKRISFRKFVRARLEGCTWLRLPFHWPALGCKATSDGNVVPKKSQETPVLVQSQEKTPLAFTVGNNSCTGEELERKRETALGCACGKGFNSGDQRLTKPLERQVVQKSRKLLLMFRKSGRSGISGSHCGNPHCLLPWCRWVLENAGKIITSVSWPSAEAHMSSYHGRSCIGPSLLLPGKSHSGASDSQTLSWNLMAGTSGKSGFRPSALLVKEWTRKGVEMVVRCH